MQRDQEMRDLEALKREEMAKREIIEREKERLIKENEDILKSYYSKGYYKTLTNYNK